MVNPSTIKEALEARKRQERLEAAGAPARVRPRQRASARPRK
jgi:hypothetical protein